MTNKGWNIAGLIFTSLATIFFFVVEDCLCSQCDMWDYWSYCYRNSNKKYRCINQKQSW